MEPRCLLQGGFQKRLTLLRGSRTAMRHNPDQQLVDRTGRTGQDRRVHRKTPAGDRSQARSDQSGITRIFHPHLLRHRNLRSCCVFSSGLKPRLKTVSVFIRGSLGFIKNYPFPSVVLFFFLPLPPYFGGPQTLHGSRPFFLAAATVRADAFSFAYLHVLRWYFFPEGVA